MTKEERIKKWFSNIPDAELISMEIKMEICKKAAKKMMIIIFGLLALELVLLLMLGGGNILSRTADFLNRRQSHKKSLSRRRFCGNTCVLTCFNNTFNCCFYIQEQIP